MFAILERCRETWKTYRNMASPATMFLNLFGNMFFLKAISAVQQDFVFAVWNTSLMQIVYSLYYILFIVCIATPATKGGTSVPPGKSKDKPKIYTFIYVGAGVAFLVIVLLIIALIVTRLRR